MAVYRVLSPDDERDFRRLWPSPAPFKELKTRFRTDQKTMSRIAGRLGLAANRSRARRDTYELAVTGGPKPRPAAEARHDENLASQVFGSAASAPIIVVVGGA